MNIKKIIYILLLLAITLNVFPQPKVVIFHESASGDTVDLGMCMPGKELITTFNVKNLSDGPLRMLGFNPTYGAFGLPGHPGEYNEFFPVSNFPFDVSPKNLRKFYFKFQAFTGSFPPRKNTARLRIGFFNPDSIALPDNEDDLAGYRDFVVIARKTEHYIDVFEDFISFDSVYVYPKDSVRKRLIVQNSSPYNLEIFKAEYTRSLNAEIIATVMAMPLQFTPWQTENYQHVWDFSYYPRNMGLDTAMLTLSYKPDPVNYPDSIDVRTTRIRAVGVQQDLGIIKAEEAKSFTFNSIDFGDVDVGDYKEVKFVVRTIGNIPFGALSQKILQYDAEAPAEGFSLVRKMVDTLDLQPYLTDTLIVRFTPPRSDTFRVRLVIESDIIHRNIIGYPDSVRYRTFILEGVGREAEIAAMPEEIDFGNIIVNESGDCPTRRDTLIPVSNIGNRQLLVLSKVQPDNNKNPFKVQPKFLTVPGRKTKYIQVTFDSIITKPGYYEADLYIISNSPADKDTLITKLKARGIYPDTTDIKIPEKIKSAAGRRVSIPVLIEKDKATVARVFTDTITYNKSILFFYGTRKAGTASELCEVSAVQSDEFGALYLKINTLGSERFLPRDTLIVLEFDVYLGDAKQTALHFINPKFSDGICEQILSLNKQDGSFEIDSICGLDMKTGKQYYNGILFNSVFPNPASDNFNFEFALDNEYYTEICLYNSFGEKVATLLKKKMKAGIYKIEKSLNKLPAGLYFVEIRAGIYRQIKRFIVTD